MMNFSVGMGKALPPLANQSPMPLIFFILNIYSLPASGRQFLFTLRRFRVQLNP